MQDQQRAEAKRASCQRLPYAEVERGMKDERDPKILWENFHLIMGTVLKILEELSAFNVFENEQ